MSFSTDVKEELSKLSNLANKDLVKAEMYGYLCSNNVSEDNGCIRFSTESEYNINRFAKLLNNLNISKYNIEIVGKNFIITIEKKYCNNITIIYNTFYFYYKEKFIPLATTSFIFSIKSSISFGVTIKLYSFGFKASFISS